MANINSLIVFTEARQLVREIRPITTGLRFGDLGSQIRRASISIASNICEGAGAGSDRQFVRYLKLARASANEVLGQLLLLADLGTIGEDHQTIALADRLGRRLTCLIRSIGSG